MNTKAPSQAPSIRVSPPITAITRSWIVACRSMTDGERCPVHQTNSTPASAATSEPERERERPVQHDVVAERRHPHGVVADTLERKPERRADDVAQERVDGERDDEGDVVEPLAVVDTGR